MTQPKRVRRLVPHLTPKPLRLIVEETIIYKWNPKRRRYEPYPFFEDAFDIENVEERGYDPA